MHSIIITSNMYNEINQLPRWFSWVKKIADGGILIVDSGSNDGTIEYAKEQGAIVIIDDIIRREGYGPARTQMRELAKKYFPKAHWSAFFDADEDLSEDEFHIFRWIKDYLEYDYDVVAFPRIDWYDFEKTKAENDYRYAPDWQARMTRLDCPDIKYIRRLHEQVVGHKAIYCNLTTPKINHYHRAIEDKRDAIGKLCAKLHSEDKEYGNTYPKHKYEDKYYNMYLEKGLD